VSCEVGTYTGHTSVYHSTQVTADKITAMMKVQGSSPKLASHGQ